MTCSVGHFVVRTHEFVYFCGCLVTPLKMKWDSFVVATFACFWYNALLCQGFYLPGMAPQSFCSKDKVSTEYDCKVAIHNSVHSISPCLHLTCHINIYLLMCDTPAYLGRRVRSQWWQPIMPSLSNGSNHRAGQSHPHLP